MECLEEVFCQFDFPTFFIVPSRKRAAIHSRLMEGDSDPQHQKGRLVLPQDMTTLNDADYAKYTQGKIKDF